MQADRLMSGTPNCTGMKDRTLRTRAKENSILDCSKVVSFQKEFEESSSPRQSMHVSRLGRCTGPECNITEYLDL